MKFTLEIDLDETKGEPLGFQVTDALNHAVTTISGMLGADGEPDACVFIRDAKGKPVGKWVLA